MNAENFIEYLAKPSKLYQLPYQEIKNLVAEYPYSTNLRQLLLLKSKIEQDPKFEQHLHDLAAHSFDRQYLFEFVHQQIPQLLELDIEPAERLELKDLSQLAEEKVPILIEQFDQQDLDPPPVQTTFVESPPLQPETNTIAEEIGNEEEEEAVMILPYAEEKVEAEEEATDENIDAGLVDLAGLERQADAKGDTARETEPTPTDTAEVPEVVAIAYRIPSSLLTTLISGSLLNGTHLKPKPKTSFDSWQKRQSNAEQPWKHLRHRRQQTDATEEKPHSARQIAKQSIQDQTNLASETLAKLLTRQGQYRKAIKIYQRLGLLYPEKSRYFAATIEELKQKI